MLDTNKNIKYSGALPENYFLNIFYFGAHPRTTRIFFHFPLISQIVKIKSGETCLHGRQVCEICGKHHFNGTVRSETMGYSNNLKQIFRVEY
jgi:hypothetical protein